MTVKDSARDLGVVLGLGAPVEQWGPASSPARGRCSTHDVGWSPGCSSSAVMLLASSLSNSSSSRRRASSSQLIDALCSRSRALLGCRFRRLFWKKAGPQEASVDLRLRSPP